MPIPWTREQAAVMAAKGLVVRRENARRRQLDKAISLSAPPIQILSPSEKPAEPLDLYLQARLLRVRAQLSLVDAMIEREKDANKLDRLASASAKLSELERVLSGRPLPGSHRPVLPRVRSQANSGLTPE